MVNKMQLQQEIETPDMAQEAMQGSDCCSPIELATFSPARLPAVASEVKLLSALADNTRLGIVEMLARLDEPLCVCDIVSEFDLGQPTISHHLRVLRDARLVLWEKRGLWVYYSLNRETLAQATRYLHTLLAASDQPAPHLKTRATQTKSPFGD